MPNMSSVFRHSLGCVCVYIYVYLYDVMQLILVLQVAVGCFFICSVLYLVSVLSLNELNLLSPTTST